MMTFEQSMRERDFTVTAMLPLAPASTRQSIAADLRELSGQVAAVHVTDSPAGIAHLSPLVAATICLEQGVDPVMHLTGRDRNRIALQSDLLGAAAAGVTSLCLYRGDKLPAKQTPRAQKVFELGAKRLLRCASLIGSEETLPPKQGFFLGSAVRVIDPAAGWMPRGLATKADVGCKFVLSQPILEDGVLARYMQRLVAAGITRRLSVLANVPLITSVPDFEGLLESPRGALLPEGLGKRLASAGSDAARRRLGVELCAAALSRLAGIPGVAGVAVTGCGDAALIAEAVSLSGTCGSPSEIRV